jgi:DNA (cytosine-5)-methyltransferase 1
MKALSLFSGIGGIDLASEWAGIETVAFCEREPFCQKVLKKHWPNTPIYDDVCTLTKERLEADGIGAIDLIHGGYPCQPFSHAGRREGENDERHLWPEYFRLIQELRPRWIVGENVVGHITLGIDSVLFDLEGAGYSARPVIIPAAGVGANHRRERVFIMAYDSRNGLQGSKKTRIPKISWPESTEQFARFPAVEAWNDISACYSGGKNDGVPNRMDRIKSLGNAVVPQQIYPILAAIKQIDEQWRANG